MCRYSAGHPAENGNVSGVAKNSYYIENGKIQYPIGETMIAANLGKMLMDVKDLSKETINSGSWELPWVQFDGVHIS